MQNWIGVSIDFRKNPVAEGSDPPQLVIALIIGFRGFGTPPWDWWLRGWGLKPSQTSDRADHWFQRVLNPGPRVTIEFAFIEAPESVSGFSGLGFGTPGIW